MTFPRSAPADVIAYALWPTAPQQPAKDLNPWQAALHAVEQQPAMQQLARLQAVKLAYPTDDSSCSSHECACAQALGWQLPIDLLPFAALAAHEHQLTCPPDHGWAFVDLVHAEFNQGQMFYSLPANLTASESDSFLQAMQTYFEEDGIHLQTLAAGRFLAHATSLKNLPSVSLAQVLQDGTHALAESQPLAAQSPAQRLLRRLQNEMQMLLYTHPLNEQRQQTVNSFWLSGTGDLPAGSRSHVKLHTGLQASFLAQDTQAWAAQWARLAEEVIWPALQQNRSVLLCGPQRVVQLQAGKSNWMQALKHRFFTPSLSGMLS